MRFQQRHLYFCLTAICTLSHAFGQDPDQPRIGAGIDHGRYLQLREDYVRRLRCIPMPTAARSAAVGAMKQQSIVSALNGLTTPAWVSIGPAPIPNGQTTGFEVPVSGRVTAIDVHPTNPNIAYVGTAQGGVYRTLDGGVTWTAIFDSAQSLAIGAVAIAPSSPSTVYVGTGEPNESGDSFFGVGLYRIDNADTTPVLVGPINPLLTTGTTLKYTANIFTNRSISRILVHPTDPATIFVSTVGGIHGFGSTFGQNLASGLPGVFRSTNATSTAGTVTLFRSIVTTALSVDSPPTGALDASDMVFEPGNPNNLIVGIVGPASTGNGGIYRSTNALAATPIFTQRQTLTDDYARIGLAINKVGSVVTVIAATGESVTIGGCDQGEQGVLRKSTDGGVTWSTALAGGQGFCGGQCFYDIVVDVDPNDANTVYLGGSADGTCSRVLEKSTNGGTSFTAIDNELHADSHGWRIAPSSVSGQNRTIYFGNDGGIFKSVDSGQTWNSLNNTGFNATQFQSIAVHPIDQIFTLGGTQDNGTNLHQPNGTWNRVDFGDGGYALIDQSSTNTSNVTMYHTYFNAPNNLIGFAGVTNIAQASEGSWGFFGCDDGVHTTNGIACGDNVLFYAPMALGPGNPNTVYFGTDRLYRSANRGVTMSLVSQAPVASNDVISAIGISAQNDQVRIVGTANGRVLATKTGSSTLTDITSPNFPVNGNGSPYVSRAVIDPNNSTVGYVAFSFYMPAGQGIWKTTNLGTSTGWTPIGAGIPSVPVQSLVIDPSNSANMYAGTDIGVYVSTNGGASWTPYGTGLPIVSVFDMAIQPVAHKLRVATHGRGLWEIPTVGGTPSLLINLSHAGNFTQGQQNATYTIMVSNASGASATSGTVSVTETVPTGLTLVSMAGTNWTCSSNGCNRSDALASGASYEPIAVTVNVAANAPLSVTNTASVTGGGDLTAPHTASDLTSILTGPMLALVKTHTGNFSQGQTGATYTLTVSNAGGSPTSGTVTVADVLPTGLTATAIAGTGWTCILGTLTCTRADPLAAGAAYAAITLTVNVAANAASSITNTATATGGGDLTIHNASDLTTVTTVAADLTVTLAHTGNFTQAQTGAAYTIIVTNSGNGSTSALVTVTDALPSGLTATAMTGTGWVCVLGTLACTRSDVLAAGASYSAITLTVNVAANAAASVTNGVTVAGGGETNTANDSAVDPTTIIQLPVLAIAKSHSGSFVQGQSGTYSISVNNTGSGPTTGTVTVTDTLPAGLTAAAMTGNGWTCTVATATCTRADALTGGSSYSAIILTVNVAANAAANFTNTATVAGGGDLTSPHTANDPTTTVAGPMLSIVKSHTGNFTQAQTGASYSLAVSNVGGSPTSGTVTIADVLPAGLTATAIAGTSWSCTLATLTCTRADALAAGGSYPPIAVTVNVANNAASSLTNTATATGGGDTAVHTANDPTTVIALTPDLTVAVSHSGNFTQGQTGAAYSIVVTNAGNGSTSGVVTVVDVLPASLTATAISGTGWTCLLGTLTCTRSDVLAGNAGYPAITVVTNVASNAAASVNNSVTVAGGGETNTANDTASDPTTVIQLPALTITKSHTGNFIQGQTGTYTISVGNSGTGPTSATVTVADSLPIGLTLVSLGGTGWSCTNASLACTRSDVLAAGATYPPITITVTAATNAPAQVTNSASVTGGGDPAAPHTANDPTVIATGPMLSLVKTHTGSFAQGQTGAAYTLTVTNAGGSPTSGTVTVADVLPAGLTATAMSGAGWSCTLGTLTCTRTDALAAAGAYSPIAVTVNVAANAATSLTNTATATGGGDVSVHTVNDPTNITVVAPDLTIALTHAGTFAPGQTGAVYSIAVTNSGNGATNGLVSVTDSLPFSLSATAMSGTGWACVVGTLTCTRSDVLASNGSYPVITVLVNVAANAAPLLTNSANVSGGGETNSSNDVAADPTVILQLPSLTVTATHSGDFAQGQTGAVYTITVGNSGSGPTSGVVTVADALPSGLTGTAMSGTGWVCTIANTTCTRSDALAPGASYPTISVTVNVASTATSPLQNVVTASGGASGTATATDPTVITAAASSGLRFIAVAPCRVVDTRGEIGAFGGPIMAGGSSRDFAVPSSNCGIPANARAYSLNITVVPSGGLSFLTIWPTGQAQPVVSTLNAFDGRIVANAATVPAGTNGSVSVFVSDASHVVIDINGYFVPVSTAGSLSFYPTTPCRVVDTRGGFAAPFGSPFLAGGSSRNFPIPASSCAIPNSAQAYSLNFTVVPHGTLGNLTSWPTGQPQPNVSTLNSADGSIVANAAIVPAGTNGAVSVFATNDTDVIIDINGYFAAPGSPGAESLYTIAPCRIVDTRGGFPVPFGSPILGANTSRSFPLNTSSCGIPAGAQAYSLNLTVVPPGPLVFLTAWPTGQTQPVVSTLNSPLAKVLANAAILPAGAGGAISVFVSNTTDLIIDANAYFAP